MLLVALAVQAAGIEDARDRQDRAAIAAAVRERAATAERLSKDAQAQYLLAAARSLEAEVALELKDKNAARAAAEAGIAAAEKAIALAPKSAEYHRMLGTLCGQVIPAQVLLALKYGGCARDSIEKAIALDPKSAKAYLSRGVGNFYLPDALGGGAELAIRDFQKAIELDPKSAEAHLWLGIALRKAKRNAEARKEIAKSLELNPRRVWAQQQLEKTPAQ